MFQLFAFACKLVGLLLKFIGLLVKFCAPLIKVWVGAIILGAALTINNKLAVFTHPNENRIIRIDWSKVLKDLARHHKNLFTNLIASLILASRIAIDNASAGRIISKFHFKLSYWVQIHHNTFVLLLV